MLCLFCNTLFVEAGIYCWIISFPKNVVDKAGGLQPIVGNTWIADEAVLKVGGRNIWFWELWTLTEMLLKPLIIAVLMPSLSIS